MKTIFASFSSLLAVSALFFSALPALSDEVPADASNTAFKRCSDAIKNPGTAEESFVHKRLHIRDSYDIDVYVATVAQAQKIDIVVWIENKQATGDEEPAITAVCVGNKLNAPTAPKGQIEFQSSMGDKIKFRFHLEGLKKSKWKKNMSGAIALANDSIQMQQVPGAATWPPCLGKKFVYLIDDPATPSKKETDSKFDFSQCSNTGIDTLYYEYTLLLNRYPASGGPPVTYPIDPWIINHP